MDESGIAVLDGPALSHGIGVPAEGYAVGGDVAGGEASDVGASGGGEGNGVAPVALKHDGTADGTDRNIVGEAGREAAESDRMRGDTVDAVEATGEPYVDIPNAFVACHVPVESGIGIGNGRYGQAVGSHAGQAVGEESILDPVGESNTVGRAILTYTESVVGGRIEAGEGVAVAGDMDVGGRPIGSGAFLDINLVVGAQTGPGDGGRLIIVANRSNNRIGAGGNARGEPHDWTPLIVCLRTGVAHVERVGIGTIGVPSDGLIIRAGFGFEHIGRTIVGIGVVVDDNQEVACAGVAKHGVEGKVVPTLSAVERTGIDLESNGSVEEHHVGSGSKRALGCGLQIDGAVVLDRGGRCIVIVVADVLDIVDTHQIGAVDNGLGESVSIEVVDRSIVAGTCGGFATNIILNGIVANQRGERNAIAEDTAVGIAYLLHPSTIVGQVVEASDSDIVGIGSNILVGAGRSALFAIGHAVGYTRGRTIPEDTGGAGSDSGFLYIHIHRTRAVGHINVDIVHNGGAELEVAIAGALVEPEEGNTFDTVNGIEGGTAEGPSSIETDVGNTVELVHAAPR